MDTKNNTGNGNTGNRNTGYRNTGNGNTGDWNTGYRNTGDWNTGNGNTGNGNTGNRNTGYRNTGNGNTGDRNTGDWNTGNGNTGNGNTGNRNTGYGNSTNRETGIFNTKSGTIRIFNKDSGKTFDEIDHPHFLEFYLTKWIDENDMTDEEKKADPDFYVKQGYLKSFSYAEAWANFWKETDEDNRQKFLSLPNFDAGIFLEITGIDVRIDKEKQSKKEAILKKIEELKEEADKL